MAALAQSAAQSRHFHAAMEYSPWEQDAHDNDTRPKRAKVALACQRCKKRKQKCDGAYPCSKCEVHRLDCEYVVPQKPMPFGKNHYIDALERRIAELETVLATHGLQELSSDHWRDWDPSMHAATPVDADPGPARLEKSASPSRDERSYSTLDWQGDINPIVSILRSLSLDANGSDYIGASSHVALGRLFNFLGRDTATVSSSGTQRPAQANLPRRATENLVTEPIDFTDVPPDVADRLFAGYLKHIATRFPIVHSVWARELHLGRQSLTDAFERSTLHLIYAAAGRFIETTGESGNFSVKRHYEAAVQSLDAILEHNDIRTVQTLMLMAIYCLRDPVGAGAWTYSRTALLIAIDHGLHRQMKGMSRLSLENELRKRLFWACYCFDRQISIPMGRPFGISDRDIDLDIPLDVDEDSIEENLASLGGSLHTPSITSTTLTSFIKTIKLRQIESEIQQTIYRVDRTMPVDNAAIDYFLGRLTEWKDTIPQDTKHFKDVDVVPYDGYDFYVRVMLLCFRLCTASNYGQLVFYYKCQRLLLYPCITKPDFDVRFLKECARACAGVCGAYKRLHQSLAVGYSSMAVQTVFMAGRSLEMQEGTQNADAPCRTDTGILHMAFS